MINEEYQSKVVCALSVSRSDLWRMVTIYKELLDQPKIEFHLIMAGSHYFLQFGESDHYIKELGLKATHNIKHLETSSPQDTCSEIIREVHSILTESGCDYLLLFGDRFEMLAAGQAALLAGVPILHIGGGHLTEGAIDDQCRHALTKLANRHYVACNQHEKRLRQMGEEPESILNVGSPEIDELLAVGLIDRGEFCREVNLNADHEFVLVTLHPETHEKQNLIDKVEVIFSFLQKYDFQILITAPCQDEGWEVIYAKILDVTSNYPEKFIYRAQLGESLYVNAMHHCEFMLGNSSSGIIESASIGTGVINVGTRQGGRLRAKNVIDCDWNCDSLERAMGDLKFMELGAIENPYGDGKTCERIILDILALPKNLGTTKKFLDIVDGEGKN